MTSTISFMALEKISVPEDHILAADAWARSKCAELQKQGVNARLWRPPRKESLCVVYRVAQAQEAAQEAVA